MTHVKVVCGNIEPLWFMSDDAEQYFNAWRGVFSSMKTRKLLCVWHIHRAWCKALREHVGSKDDQIGIYHTLCVLLQEHDESKMRMSLQAFLTDLYSNQERFYLYFNSTYCSRVQEWATCYRKGCTANTNMFIESFHRVLKVVYLHHKQNRRVDFLLVMLMKISRNNTFEWFRKLEIGKQTHRICEIARRHKSALSLSSNCISTVTKEKWKVTSQTIQNKDYTIERVLEACDCKILCRDCNICPHIYTCTCLDATLHATVCKHVHLVCIQNGNSNKTIMMQTNDYTYFNDVLFQNLTETTDLNADKQKLLSCLKELENEIKVCNEIDSIHTARKHVQAAVSIIKAMKNQRECAAP